MKRILILFAAVLAVNSVTFANPFSNADQISIEKNLRPVVVNPTVRGVHGRITNCNEWISLRSEPTVYADRLARMYLGEELTVYQSVNEEFYLVRYQGTLGYALKNYIRID